MKDLILKSESGNFLIKDQEFSSKQSKEATISDVEEKETGILEFSISSDEPYQRWWGTEILSHEPSAVNLVRLNNSANILYNHNFNDYIAVCLKGFIQDGKTRVQTKWNLNNPDYALPRRIYEDIGAGILKNSSVGYEINELTFKNVNTDKEVGVATRWTPFEGSIVTVPADYTVGVGRSYYDLAPAINNKPEKGENSEKHADIVSGDKSMSGENDSTATVAVNENDIRSQERERIAVITAQGKKYGCPEIAEKAIEDGMSVENARSLMADKVLGRSESEQNPVARTLAPVDMGNNDANKYSFLRAIGVATGKLKSDQAGLEVEVSDHLQKTRMGGKPPEGIYVDTARLASYRAPYDTQTPAAAGNLISTDLMADRFIEALYNQSAFLSAGVTYMRDLTGNVEIPRESTYTNGYWVGESQTIPEDEGTFDKINLSPKKLACRTRATYEMIHQSSIDLERLMRARLIRGLALELDRTIGFGSGVGSEPLGIISHPEVLSIVLGANGGALDWAAVVNMQGEVDDANAMMGGDFCYIGNSRTRAKLMQTLDHGTGNGKWIWQDSDRGRGEGRIAGYPAKKSNQIPNNLVKGTATNLTALFFGDFSNVLLGIWAALDVMVDPYSQSDNAIIKLIAKQLADIQLTRGSYFCVATDVQNN